MKIGRIIYTLLALVFCLSAQSARQGEKKAYFDRWNSVPSQHLMNRAKYILSEDGNKDSALIFYNVVYNRYVLDSNNRDKAKLAIKALNGMGYLMAFSYFNYEQAYNYFSQSLELSEQWGLDEYTPVAYTNLGVLITTQWSYINPPGMKDALPYFKKGFYISAKQKDWNTLLVAFNNMLSIVFTLGKPVDPDLIRSEVDFFDTLRIPSGTDMLQFARQEALVYKAVTAGRIGDALGIAEKCLVYIPSGHDSIRYVVNVQSIQAYCLLRLKQYDKSLGILRLQLQEAKDNGIKDMEPGTYRDMMIVCQAMGDSVSANRYEYFYLKAKDDILFGEHKLAGIDNSRLIHQLKKTNDEIIENARRERLAKITIIFLLIFAATIVVFSVMVFRRNKQLRERNHKLYLTIQESIAAKPIRNVDEARARDILDRIEKALSDNSVLCSKDMSINYLSEVIGVPQKQVSQVINEHLHKNFSQLLAEWRIREACRRIQDKENYGNYTVEAIGESVGFHTRSNFFATFKRITGLTTTEFLREENDRENAIS